MLIFPLITVVLSIVHTMEAKQGEFKNVIRVTDDNPQPHCRKGQYFSSSRNACVACRRCDLFSVRVTECNATSDAVCVKCLSDTGDLREKFNDPVCKFCKPCGPGEYVKKPCDPYKKRTTQCEKCEHGSFKVMKSFSTHCVPCTDCGNMQIKTECTNRTDTDCGQCKPGYYLDRSRNVCHRCRSCMSGEKTRDECLQGYDGKHCGGIFLRPVQYQNFFAGKDASSTVNAAVMTTTTTTTTSHPSTAHQSDAQTSGKYLEEMALLIAVISLVLISIAALAVPIAVLALKLRRNRAGPAVITEPPPGSEKNTYVVLHVTAGDVTRHPSSKCLPKQADVDNGTDCFDLRAESSKCLELFTQKIHSSNEFTLE